MAEWDFYGFQGRGLFFVTQKPRLVPRHSRQGRGGILAGRNRHLGRKRRGSLQSGNFSRVFRLALPHSTPSQKRNIYKPHPPSIVTGE